MPLNLDGEWVWDFWLAHDGPDWHIFFLKAPRSLGDPERRHRHATIGHAVSDDLSRWTVVAAPFEPGPPGTWDDLATWTGSVVRANGVWWMFYTGVSTAEDGKIQRIGAAVSQDLMLWTKTPENPLLEADVRWYEIYDERSWYEQAWRDPWVCADPDGAGYHMFLTARVASGEPDRRGVIAHAVSPDLRAWEVRPPVTEAGWAGHLEVPQHVALSGRHYLVFSVPREMQPGVDPSAVRTGVAYLVADRIDGTYEQGPTRYVYADTSGTFYAGRVVLVDGRPMMMATLHNDMHGGYVGTISDPMPLIVGADGRLQLGRDQPVR